MQAPSLESFLSLSKSLALIFSPLMEIKSIPPKGLAGFFNAQNPMNRATMLQL